MSHTLQVSVSMLNLKAVAYVCCIKFANLMQNPILHKVCKIAFEQTARLLKQCPLDMFKKSRSHVYGQIWMFVHNAQCNIWQYPKSKKAVNTQIQTPLQWCEKLIKSHRKWLFHNNGDSTNCWIMLAFHRTVNEQRSWLCKWKIQGELMHTHILCVWTDMIVY